MREREIVPIVIDGKTAVALRVTQNYNTMLQSDEVSVSFTFVLTDSIVAVVKSGDKQENGELCADWNGNYDQAYNYVANYLGVVLI
jgi:hypothetical protein